MDDRAASLVLSVLFLGALAGPGPTASAQCSSTVQGTSGNPFPLVIGAQGDCVANSLPVPPTTADHQSGTTPLGCGATQQQEMWFTFTANTSETLVRLYGNSVANIGFMVYAGPCASTMDLVTCVGYDGPTSQAMIAAIVTTLPGQRYYVRVSRRNSNAFPASLRICGWDYARIADHPACDGNASFELGTTEGWTCRYGHYDLAMNLPHADCLNPDGMDAPLSPGDGTVQPWNGGNRHTIMSDKRYLDPRTNYVVPAVAPGGGNYSFRIGNNDHGCGVPGDAPCPAQASSMNLALQVTRQNALFTYMFAVVMEDPAHAPDEQPRFEGFLMDPGGNIVNCGYVRFVPGGIAGNLRGPGNWVYSNWIEVGMDLTPYIGQTVTLEFRVSNSYPATGGNTCSCSGGTCTMEVVSGGSVWLCTGLTSCSVPNPANNPNCQVIGTHANSAGPHSAYAYIDTYCRPLPPDEDSTGTFCVGATAMELCAPPGFRNYYWPPGQPGMQAPLNQRCVTIQGPVDGTVYTVYMEMITGCPVSRTLILRLDPTCTVGIEEAPPPATLELFPNPTGDRLVIKLDPAVRVEGLRVMDAQGRVVMERTDGQGRDLDVGMLAPGVYILRLETDQGTMMGRFLKE